MIGKKCGGAKAPPSPPGSAGPDKASWTENGGTSKRLSIVFSLFHGFCYFHFFDVCRRDCRGTGQR